MNDIEKMMLELGGENEYQDISWWDDQVATQNKILDDIVSEEGSKLYDTLKDYPYLLDNLYNFILEAIDMKNTIRDRFQIFYFADLMNHLNTDIRRMINQHYKDHHDDQFVHSDVLTYLGDVVFGNVMLGTVCDIRTKMSSEVFNNHDYILDLATDDVTPEDIKESFLPFPDLFNIVWINDTNTEDVWWYYVNKFETKKVVKSQYELAHAAQLIISHVISTRYLDGKDIQSDQFTKELCEEAIRYFPKYYLAIMPYIYFMIYSVDDVREVFSGTSETGTIEYQYKRIAKVTHYEIKRFTVSKSRFNRKISTLVYDGHSKSLTPMDKKSSHMIHSYYDTFGYTERLLDKNGYDTTNLFNVPCIRDAYKRKERLAKIEWMKWERLELERIKKEREEREKERKRKAEENRKKVNEDSNPTDTSGTSSGTTTTHFNPENIRYDAKDIIDEKIRETSYNTPENPLGIVGEDRRSPRGDIPPVVNHLSEEIYDVIERGSLNDIIGYDSFDDLGRFDYEAYIEARRICYELKVGWRDIDLSKLVNRKKGKRKFIKQMEENLTDEEKTISKLADEWENGL